MYVIAGRQLPPPSFYGDYSQYENGVGSLTSFKEDFYNEFGSLPMSKSKMPVTILTAPVASGLLLELLTVLKEKRNLEFEMIICENLTFGNPVTVTGLLCGRDFKEGLRSSHHQGPVFIPPNSLNEEGKFLDDLTPEDVSREFNRPVKAPNSFGDLLRV